MKKRSLPLKTVNIIFLALIGFLCIVLVFAVLRLAVQFKSYARISDQYAVVSKSALTIQEASDYLTDQARLFVITGDYNNLNNYFTEANVTKRREKAVTDITECEADSDSIRYLIQAMEESKKLEEIEYYSMKLVILAKHYDKDPSKKVPESVLNVSLSQEDERLDDEYKIAKAWMVLFSQEYVAQKTRISELKSKAISGLFQSSKLIHDASLVDLKQIFFRLMINITGIFIFNLIFFICIIALVIRPLYMHIKSIKNGQKLDSTPTKEFNILSSTYNEMYEKNEANEILLRHKAEHDPLTGLLNRGAYDQIIQALQSQKESIALIILDVDFFKVINDTYGHATGDKILQKVSKSLEESFRNIDYVCRIGGDEFTVIMTNCGTDDQKTCNLISAKLTHLQELLSNKSDGLPDVTLSCGADISHTGYSQSLYEHADLALYETKRAGRNSFTLYPLLPESKKTASNIELL